MLTLCLAGPSTRKVIQLPPTATLKELQAEWPTAKAFSFGFPPQSIPPSQALAALGIRNQERIMVQENESPAVALNDGQSTAPRKRRKAAQKATESLATAIATQEALERTTATTSSPKQRRRPASRPRFTATTEGRRLQDGAVVSPRKRKQSDDPAVSLLHTLEDSSQQGRLLRQGWRNAVTQAYEQNQAVARLAAIASQQYTFEDAATKDQWKVKYTKGVQGRGSYTDIVDALPLPVLQAVVQGLHPSEALRPSNLAVLSPRVLWSLVYHYHQCDSVEEALQKLLPDLDWSFLRRRKTQLSAKARENLRQQQQQQQQQQEASEDWEAAAAAIASVENAMGSLQAYERTQRQATMLRAVEKRTEWKVVTPNEPDVDELLECMDEAPVENPKAWAERLMTDCNIHNWRELANVDPEDLAERLGLEEATVSLWIDRAQQESVEEIIVEICDGNTDAVELLRDVAKSGTPKDLALWTPIVPRLYTVLQRGGDETIPSTEDLQRWCLQAEAAMEQLEWLDCFVTPLV